MENTIEKDPSIHLVTFQLGTQVYALPIEPIQQVIEMVTITPVPQVRASVEGVINYHGTTVPVVNLREHLGMSRIPLKLHTPIIMTFGSGQSVGLIVDEVVAVIDLPSTQLVNPHDILPKGLGKTSLLRGLFHDHGNAVLVLDIEHLFDSQDASALAEAAAIMPNKTEPTIGMAEKPSVKRSKKPKPAPREKPSPSGRKKRAVKKTIEDK